MPTKMFVGNDVLSTPFSFINVGGNLITATKFVTANQSFAKDTSAKGKRPTSISSSGQPVKIAPKPSPMHLTAAIALSELAVDRRYKSDMAKRRPISLFPRPLLIIVKKMRKFDSKCSKKSAKQKIFKIRPAIYFEVIFNLPLKKSGHHWCNFCWIFELLFLP